MSDRTLIREQVSMFDALDMLELPRPNGDGKIMCPFHDEVTASCHVYDDRFYSYCCGQGGDVVWFVAKVTGMSLYKAERFLLGAVDELSVVGRPKVVHREREVQDLTLQYEAALNEAHGPTLRDMARALLKDKPFSLETAEKYGWVVTRDGIWIPHWHNGAVVGVKVRKFNGSKTSIPGSTFTLQPYMSWGWAGLHGEAVLCEGESDTVAMQEHLGQFVPVIGLPSGAGAGHEMIVRWLKSRYMHAVRLMLDPDDSGRKATQSIAALCDAVGIRWLDYSQKIGFVGEDVCDALAKGWTPQV